MVGFLLSSQKVYTNRSKPQTKNLFGRGKNFIQIQNSAFFFWDIERIDRTKIFTFIIIQIIMVDVHLQHNIDDDDGEDNVEDDDEGDHLW